MKNFIPKIIYNAITYTFPYPPELGSDEGESANAVVQETTSLAGEMQTSVQYIEGNLSLRFKFLKDADVAALKTFFETWAVYGKFFDYYEHATEAGFVTYQLKDKNFNPKVFWRYPDGSKLYSLELTFRRVIL